MKKSIKIFCLNCLILALASTSCKKYLEVKQNQQLSTPETLKDLQALMDNEFFYRFYLFAMQDGTDEFYYRYDDILRFPGWMIDVHTWASQTDDEQDWVEQYNLVLICNTVLDKVDEVPGNTSAAASEIKASALFKRALCYYQLAQIYAPPYDSGTASTDLGIVLRDDVDFNVPSQRSNVKETYDRITGDLELAATLLPSTMSTKTRPNRAAAFGLLARVYLQMGLYDKAKTAADQSLAIYDYLIDFNDNSEIDYSSYYPFKNPDLRHPEIIYYQLNYGLGAYPSAIVDSLLYSRFDDDDWRKTLFFKPHSLVPQGHVFTGSYLADKANFFGIATDEIYLIRAECNARLGNTSAAVQDLESLLNKRYKTGTLPNLNPATPEAALQLVLNERQKELPFRGVRWSDLRRLNKDGTINVTLKRILNGIEYRLEPNDLRYTLLIPARVMQLVELQQNPR